MFASFYGAHSLSVPSGACSANPAFVPGRGRSQRAFSRGALAPSEEGSKAVRPVVPCRCAVTGHCVCSANYSRSQPREAGTLSRFFGRVEKPSKRISVGPADSRKRLRYTVQVSSTSIQGGPTHSGGPRAGSGIGTGGKNSFAQGGYRTSSPSQQGVRLLQPVLHSSEEGWGVASNFRSAPAKSNSREAQVQNAYTQTDRVTNQIRGLVCHDRSKGRLLPRVHPSTTQEVPEVRFRGRSLPISGSSVRPSSLSQNVYEMHGCSSGSAATPGHPHFKLYRRLVDSSSIGASGGSTSRCRSRSYQETGVEAQCQEKCAISTTEYHLSGCNLGVNDDAGSPVSCSYRFDSHGRQTSEARPVAHCETVSETVRSDGSSVQRYTLRPVVHETVAVVAQDQGVFPEGKPAPHDQGYATVPSRLGHVERTLVPVPGSRVGSSLSSCNANDGCIPHGLGGDHEWSPSSGSVAGSPSLMAYKLLRNVGSVSGSETLSPRPERPSCSCPVRQHIGGLLHKSPGRAAFAPAIQAGSPDPPVVPGEASFIEGDLYPGVFKLGGRHPVEAGAEAQGMETPSRGDGAPMETFWSYQG